VKVIDLSYWIEQGMPVYPSDDYIKLEQDKYYEKDKYSNFKLTAGTHIGTHIDSPMHLTDSSTFIGEYSLDKFCGKACVIDVSGTDCIKYEKQYDDLVGSNEIVLLYTGFETKYGSDQYYKRHPVMDLSFAEFLASKNIKLVGFDMPSPDRFPFEIHKYLLENGIFILENLRNLNLLFDAKTIEFFAFPLKIRADASWVRAAAKID
jgi:kynurenine formamidase